MIISTVFNSEPKPLKIQTETLYISKTSNDIVVVVSICQTAPWVNIANIRGPQTTGYNWALKLADFEDQYTVFTGEVNLRNKV